MNHYLKKGLITAASLLMFAGVGAGLSSNANASHHYKGSASINRFRNTRHEYLVYDGKMVTFRHRGSNLADSDFGAPVITKGYHNYLSGSEGLWSKPGRYDINVGKYGKYYPRGVMTITRSKAKKLALDQVPFKIIKPHYYNNVYKVQSSNHRYVGWLSFNGLYSYDGDLGKLPIHFTKAHKHFVRHHVVKRNKYHKRVNKKNMKRTKRGKRHLRK